MNFEGALIGLFSFLIIGLFHPIVIKTEYHIGKRAWPIFLVVGILLTVLSVFVKSTLLSALICVFAFSSFWSIKELFEQEERVKKGWFPANPKKKKKEEDEKGQGSDPESV